MSAEDALRSLAFAEVPFRIQPTPLQELAAVEERYLFRPLDDRTMDALEGEVRGILLRAGVDCPVRVRREAYSVQVSIPLRALAELEKIGRERK